jgi:hypothetical protein
MTEEWPLLGEEQQAVDRTVREALRGVAQPQLSPFFDQRLRGRLAAERRRRRSLRRLRRVLQLYWLLAAAASAVIVPRLPADAYALAASPVLLATLLCGAALPGIILLATLRKDPVELVFETLDWLAQ